MAFRVTVGSVADCYAALGALHGAYHTLPGRFKDYISTPKSNGYRSLHTTIIGPENRKIEIQIRTAEMHEQAELGVAAHWAYKQAGGNTEGRQYRWIRELLDILEHAAGPEEFLEHTKLEMFQDQVFCFTPKGDLIALPRGATPVDFAYAVHSQVGDRCVGAKIDGRMVQLRTQLNNGDQVDIVTSRSSAPSPEWERFVVTGKARGPHPPPPRAQRRDQHTAQGREALQRAARTEGVTLGDRALEKVLEPLRQRSVEDLYAAVGDRAVSARAVLEALHPELRRKDQPRGGGPATATAPADVIVPRRPSPAPARGNGAAAASRSPILGLADGIAFRYAACCRPVPGEEIVGVVRTGPARHRPPRRVRGPRPGVPGRGAHPAARLERPRGRGGPRPRPPRRERPAPAGLAGLGQHRDRPPGREHRRRPHRPARRGHAEMLLDVEVDGLEHLPA
jgi:GTP pyrophosphokinase